MFWSSVMVINIQEKVGDVIDSKQNCRFVLNENLGLFFIHYDKLVLDDFVIADMFVRIPIKMHLYQIIRGGGDA